MAEPRSWATLAASTKIRTPLALHGFVTLVRLVEVHAVLQPESSRRAR